MSEVKFNKIDFNTLKNNHCVSSRLFFYGLTLV